MKVKRFSKKFVRDTIEHRIEDIEQVYSVVTGKKIDFQKGESQVEEQGETLNRLYGEWRGLINLLSKLSL